MLTLGKKVGVLARWWKSAFAQFACRPAAVYFPVSKNTQLVVCFSCVVIAAWKENVGVVKACHQGLHSWMHQKKKKTLAGR